MRDQSNPDQPPLDAMDDAMVSDLKDVVENMVVTLRSIMGKDVAMEVLKTILVDHNEGISLADLVQTSLLEVADFQTTYN